MSKTIRVNPDFSISGSSRRDIRILPQASNNKQANPDFSASQHPEIHDCATGVSLFVSKTIRTNPHFSMSGSSRRDIRILPTRPRIRTPIRISPHPRIQSFPIALPACRFSYPKTSGAIRISQPEKSGFRSELRDADYSGCELR